MIKICKTCREKFRISPSRLKKVKNCSMKCRNKWLSKIRKGIKNDNLINFGQDNAMWKGDNVGYSGIHSWIVRKKGKSSEYICELIDETCKGRMHWSNISHKYKRDVSDFRPLCHSHALRYDITDEYRENNSKAQLGKKMSEETKRKISLASTKRWKSNTYRKKLSAIQKSHWAIKKLKEQTTKLLTIF